MKNEKLKKVLEELEALEIAGRPALFIYDTVTRKGLIDGKPCALAPEPVHIDKVESLGIDTVICIPDNKRD